jgi:hypothetical protein
MPLTAGLSFFLRGQRLAAGRNVPDNKKKIMEDKISTRSLDLIPPIDKLKGIIFGLSALDSIISGGTILSYYPKWNNNDIIKHFIENKPVTEEILINNFPDRNLLA